jgi:hypothetical protein
VVREDYNKTEQSFCEIKKELPYCKYMKKDSVDSLDSSLSVLNEYQKNRIKQKIKKENTLYGVNKLRPASSLPLNNKRTESRKTTLPARLKNVKENLNNEERKKYIEIFNKINYSNKPAVCKSDLSLSEKVRLLYK